MPPSTAITTPVTYLTRPAKQQRRVKHVPGRPCASSARLGDAMRASFHIAAEYRQDGLVDARGESMRPGT